jgi:hypothetical protein
MDKTDELNDLLFAYKAAALAVGETKAAEAAAIARVQGEYREMRERAAGNMEAAKRKLMAFAQRYKAIMFFRRRSYENYGVRVGFRKAPEHLTCVDGDALVASLEGRRMLKLIRVIKVPDMHAINRAYAEGILGSVPPGAEYVAESDECFVR